MDLKQYVFNWIYNNVGLCLTIVLSFIEIAPIKVNPIRWICKKFADIMATSIDKSLNLTARIEENNRNIEKLKENNEAQFAAVKEKITRMEKDRQELKAKNSRTRILQFADEISRGSNHSKDFFNDILDDIDRYERYCNEHPEFSNGRTVTAKALIKKKYAQNLEGNSFL